MSLQNKTKLNNNKIFLEFRIYEIEINIIRNKQN